MSFQAGYVKLLKNGKLAEKASILNKHLDNCMLCPHECAVDRKEGTGFCQAKNKSIVANYGPHFGEEAVLTGKRGSGTIFFGYCNMRCVYCQNHSLSFAGEGKAISDERLAEIMLEIQNEYGCHNINLVSPTHFLANIVNAVHIAAQKGLYLPLVYNSSGYEKVEILKILDGIVDIYMPDFKYFHNESARKLSQINDYPARVKAALKEMNRQVGGLKTESGIAFKGLIVRHLVLPGNLDETKLILNFLKKELSSNILVNLMGQYYPAHLAYNYDNLNRRLSRSEYREVHDYASSLDLRLSEA